MSSAVAGELLAERRVGDFGVMGRRRGDVQEIQLARLGSEQRGMVRVDAGEGKHLMRCLPAGFTDVSNGRDLDCSAVAHMLCVGGRVALARDESVANYRAAQWLLHVPAIATTRLRVGKPLLAGARLHLLALNRVFSLVAIG